METNLLLVNNVSISTALLQEGDSSNEGMLASMGPYTMRNVNEIVTSLYGTRRISSEATYTEQKYVMYLRKSSEKKSQNKSLENQKETIEASFPSIEFKGVYSESHSAKDGTPKKLSELVSSASDGTRIVVRDVSRLVRNPVHLLMLLNVFLNKRIVIISCLDTTTVYDCNNLEDVLNLTEAMFASCYHSQLQRAFGKDTNRRNKARGEKVC